MNWKPNRWIALALNLFLFPFGMLYVGQARWAIIYVLTNLTLVFTAMALLNSAKEAEGLAGLLSLTIIAISTIHTFRTATRYQVSTLRPWYSHWYGFALIFLAIAIPLVVTRAFFFEPFKLPSVSMEPSYPQHSQIIIPNSDSEITAPMA